MSIRSSMESILPFMAVTSTEQAAGEAMFDSNTTGDIIRMTRNQEAIFLIVKLAGGTGTATATVQSCSAMTTAGTETAIPFHYRAMTTNGTWGAVTRAASSGVTISAGANQIWMIGVRGADMVDGDIAVRIVETEVDSTAVDGLTVGLLLQPRYSEHTTIIT